MTRTITSALLAFSIAAASLTATPVQASDKDLGRFLAGALTLMIISNAINEKSAGKSKGKKSQVPVAKMKRPAAPIKPAYGRFLPGECFFRLPSNAGPRGVFGKICLNEFMRDANRLPNRCEETVRIRYGRKAEVYDAMCLRRNGYRLASYRR